MERVVLDTCIVISAFRSRFGASNRLLDLVGARTVIPLATPPLFLEYEEVLKRSDQREVSGLSLTQIDAVLAALASAIEPVEVRFSWRPQLADPDDEMVLDAAVNGRADALVTYNVSDFEKAALRFGLTLLSPAAFLTRIRS